MKDKRSCFSQGERFVAQLPVEIGRLIGIQYTNFATNFAKYTSAVKKIVAVASDRKKKGKYCLQYQYEEYIMFIL